MLEARCISTVCLYIMIFGLCSGYDYFNDDKRQDLVPFPRIGRSDTEWMIRYLLLFSLVVVAVNAIKFGKKCETTDDCEEDECCLNYYLWIGKRCKSRPKLNGFCLPDYKKEEDGSYVLDCPCAENTICRLGKSFFDKVPKCRSIDDDSTEEPDIDIDDIHEPDEITDPLE